MPVRPGKGRRSDAKHFAKCGNGKTLYWCRWYCRLRKDGTCCFVKKRSRLEKAIQEDNDKKRSFLNMLPIQSSTSNRGCMND